MQPWIPPPGESAQNRRAPRPAESFLLFLKEVVSLCPRRKRFIWSSQNHLVRTSSWSKIPGFQFHFTPTYSSWLNQVELWFAKVEREVMAARVDSVSNMGP